MFLKTESTNTGLMANKTATTTKTILHYDHYFTIYIKLRHANEYNLRKNGRLSHESCSGTLTLNQYARRMKTLSTPPLPAPYCYFSLWEP